MPISLISKSISHFLLSSLFWKLSQPLGQDQQNSKQTYCQLPIIIFLSTPKGFLSPESFLNFLLNLYVPPWLPNSFKFIVVRLLQMQNSPSGFYHYPRGRRELRISPEQHFLKIFFLEQKEDFVVAKIAKINKGIGHKFWYIPLSLQPLQFWFMFCCTVI